MPGVGGGGTQTTFYTPIKNVRARCGNTMIKRDTDETLSGGGREVIAAPLTNVHNIHTEHGRAISDIIRLNTCVVLYYCLRAETRRNVTAVRRFSRNVCALEFRRDSSKKVEYRVDTTGAWLHRVAVTGYWSGKSRKPAVRLCYFFNTT